MSELLLAAHPCAQCLTSKARIVSGERAAQIVRDCKRTRTHFFCHKPDPEMRVHCRGVHEALGGSTTHDFAVAYGIPVREINTDEIVR